MSFIITRGFQSNTTITRGYAGRLFEIITSIIEDLIFRRASLVKIYKSEERQRIFKRGD